MSPTQPNIQQLPSRGEFQIRLNSFPPIRYSQATAAMRSAKLMETLSSFSPEIWVRESKIWPTDNPMWLEFWKLLMEEPKDGIEAQG